MPELPEVETICEALRNGGRGGESILGRSIVSSHILWEGSLAEPSALEFKRRIPGQLIEAVQRRGKFILIKLSDDTLLIHLRMSGDLLVEQQSDPVAEHHRVMLGLSDHLRLAFNDTRKFGRFWLVEDPQTVVGDLGPEPLNGSFTPQIFHQRLQSHRRQLKPLLLDQHFIAGLGNIYTDEALHRARLHPLVISDTLDPSQADRLLQSIRQVLEEGIQRQGASIDWIYRGGDFQNYFSVYQRTGEPCPNCGQPILRILVGQRSTHFCGNCQVPPLPKTKEE